MIRASRKDYICLSCLVLSCLSCLSVSLSVCLSICPSVLSCTVSLSVCLSIYLSYLTCICLPARLSVLFVCLSACMTACLSVCLLFARLPACMYVYVDTSSIQRIVFLNCPLETKTCLHPALFSEPLPAGTCLSNHINQLCIICSPLKVTVFSDRSVAPGLLAFTPP